MNTETFEEIIVRLADIDHRIDELQNTQREMIKTAVELTGIVSKQCYYSKELGKKCFPILNFKRDHNGHLYSTGATYSNNRVLIPCIPARKDGEMATRGMWLLDVSKLTPVKPTVEP